MGRREGLRRGDEGAVEELEIGVLVVGSQRS